MQLTVRDVALLLNVSERTVYRWIKHGVIPVYKISDQYRFNKPEILEWVRTKKMNISSEIFKEEALEERKTNTLLQALKDGGVYYKICGNDKKSILESVVDVVKLPQGIDRNLFLEILMAREELSSTGIGDGIAIPHVRNPIVLNVSYSMMALCFLEKPIDFGAIDNKPVDCLFLLISSTVKDHLYLLSRLSFVLGDLEFKELLKKQELKEKIFSKLSEIESNLSK